MIRSTRHHLKDMNSGKYSEYQRFLTDYSDLCKTIVDKIWETLPLDLSVSKYYDYKKFELITELSARVQSSATTQAAGIVKASIEKQRRRLWYKNTINSSANDIKFTKPKLDFVAPNLSSKCANFIKSSGKFYGFIRLSSLGKSYTAINIPIIKHPRRSGTLKGGFILFKDTIQLAWDVETIGVNGANILAIDQGLSSVAACSDGQITPDHCNHGHSLSIILDKLSRKKKGSNAFKKAQQHRKNFINWSINQLNFQNVKEVRLEKVVNIRFKKKSSRKMSHWSNPEIRDKIKRKCEELEVPIIEQSCAYRSQRCHNCGQVRKANRNGKHYNCKNCSYNNDADLNAALNHSIDLPDIPKSFLGLKLNLKNGFIWNSFGFFNLDGSEIRVPNS